MPNLADTLKDFLTWSGWTSRDLADAVPVSYWTVRRWERGATKWPQKLQDRRLREVLAKAGYPPAVRAAQREAPADPPPVRAHDAAAHHAR